MSVLDAIDKIGDDRGGWRMPAHFCDGLEETMDETDSVEFAEPYLQMTCIDPAPDADPALLAEFDRYYTEVHTPDVVRNNPGIRRAYRYALWVPDGGGAFGPKWLSVYEWSTRHGAQVFVVRAEDPAGSWRPDYLPEPSIWMAVGRGPQQWGRLMCNKLGETSPSATVPAAIMMEGIDTPENCSAAQDDAFRRTYLQMNGSDAGYGRAYQRIVKYEFEELGTKPNAPADRPRYLSIHEADADTAAALSGGIPAADMTAGSDLWRSRRVAWRHLYRRVSTCIYPGARYAARML
jgi:hypothetical protein